MVKMNTEIVTTDNRESDKAAILPYKPRPIRVRSIKHAKRLLSRIITDFQRGEVSDQNAKTLCYLLISYVTITRDYDFEQRITKIENTMRKEL